MARTAAVYQSLGWDCPNCRREAFIRFPIVHIDWTNPDDVEALAATVTPTKLEELRTKHQPVYKKSVPPLYLPCKACGFEIYCGPPAAEFTEEADPDSAPAPPPAPPPAPGPEPKPEPPPPAPGPIDANGPPPLDVPSPPA